MRKAALGSILAAIWLKEHTDALVWRCSTLALQELVNTCVILVRAIPILKLIFVDIKANFPCADSLYNTNFYGNWVIAKDNSLTYFSFWQLVIVLEVVWIILLRLILILEAHTWWHHRVESGRLHWHLHLHLGHHRIKGSSVEIHRLLLWWHHRLLLTKLLG